MKLFVGNLAPDVGDEDLLKAFEAFGGVESAVVIKDKFSGESRGFGFVEMPSVNEARAAMNGLNQQELKGRPLTVNEARPREDRGGGGGGSRDRRGGGGRSGGGFGHKRY